MEQKKGKQDLWDSLIKPAAIILAIIIFVFILQAIFNFSNKIKWVAIAIASIIWVAYYYFFDFPYSEPDELPDEV